MSKRTAVGAPAPEPNRRKLVTRIEELERRVQELEARPLPLPQPIYIPTYPYNPPGWWGIYPPSPTPIITWGTTTSGFVTDA